MQKERINTPPQEHKKQVLWAIFAKLDKASQGCKEIDLPLFGEILLMKWEELVPEFGYQNTTFNELKEIIEKIRNCKPDPDHNIFLAKSICQKLLEDDE